MWHGAWLVSQWVIPLGGGRRMAFPADELAWLSVAGGVLAAVLLVALYRYERRLVSPRVGWALLGLRVAAAVLLALALLDPVMEIREQETLRGRIVLGVDVSSSMDTADTARSAEEQSRLEAGPKTRLERAARMLRSEFLSKLESVGDVEAIAFAREAISESKAEAVADLMDDSEALGRIDRLASEVLPVLQRAGAGEAGEILGVVLLSDGRINVPGREIQSVGRLLAAQGVPVHGVLVGSTSAPHDGAVAALSVPDRVLKGDTVDVTATIKADGEVPGAPISVVLERGGAVVERKMVALGVNGERPTVTFHVPAERVGLDRWTVRVEPMAGDVRADNDARSASVEVVDEKARVLLIDSEARWEFRYVANALDRDPQVALETVVFRQEVGEAASASYGTRLPEVVAGQPDPLNGFDLIVLGDVEEADFSEADWRRLAMYVDARGGTLVWSSGLNTAEVVATHASARAMLPIVDPRRRDPTASESQSEFVSLPPGLAVRPASLDGLARWPMLRFADEPEANRAIWGALPGQSWVLQGQAKPGAEVLARVSGEEDGVVMAAMPFGLGRVFWIGFDATWRWRHRAGDTRHQRFWGQLVRWANQDRLTAGNALVRFGTVRRRFDVGANIGVQARFAEQTKGLGPDWLVVARIYRAALPRGGADAVAEAEGEPLAVVPLRASRVQPRLFEADAPPLGPGMYVLRMEIPQLGEPLDAAAVFEVSVDEGSERVELTATADPMENLAGLTGGRVFRDYDANSLFEVLKPRARTRERVESATVWDRPLALLAFFGVLTVEWVLRKRAGLP